MSASTAYLYLHETIVTKQVYAQLTGMTCLYVASTKGEVKYIANCT